jgi:membrane protease YdiL (CAAX protease family)
MQEQIQDVRKEIVIFLIITLALSAIFYVLVIFGGGMLAQGGLYALGLMWCPGIAALATRLITHRSLRGMGWGWGKTRYQILSYLIPLLYSLVVYVLVWLLGLGRVIEDLPPNLIINLLIGAVVGVLGSCVSALGEEVGWRGLLVPQLAKLTTFTKTCLISGVLWSVWHYPLILFSDYQGGILADYDGERVPVWFALICFTVMVLGINIAMNWLRLKSGSLWTAMLFHAVHNYYVQRVFDPLTTDTGITVYIIGEFGVALALAGLIVGWLFWRKRARLPNVQLRVK